MSFETFYEVAIIGGSVAGLNCALILGRSNRTVLVISDGPPRNSAADKMHNFLTHDGSSPAEYLKKGREDVQRYKTVDIVDKLAQDVKAEDGMFYVTIADVGRIAFKKVVFATGLKDNLPAIDGLEKFWAKGIYHCPYCHGYEHTGQPWAIIGHGHENYIRGILFRHWTSSLTFFTNGKTHEVTSTQLGELIRSGARILTDPIVKVSRNDDANENEVMTVHTSAGTHTFGAVFTATYPTQHSDLPASLGCKITENGIIDVDATGATSVKGVYAAGDCTEVTKHQVILAAASGSAVGHMVNLELAKESFEAANRAEELN
jgi:thioredoxin reductase